MKVDQSAKLVGRASVLLLVILLTSLGIIDQASAQSAGVELNVAEVTAAPPEDLVVVPINFVSHDIEVTATTFSIDFDEQCLTYVSTEFFLPASVSPGASFDASDTDGEIDFSMFQFVGNPVPLEDGKIAEMTFETCDAVAPNVVFAPILFSSSPTATFSNGVGADVPGTTSDGKVVVVPAGVDFNADLAVTKVDQTDPVRAGGTINYAVTVTNNGPLDATNVTLVDDLPVEATFVSSDPDEPDCTLSGNQLTCDLGTISNGGSAEVVIVLSTDGQTDATLTNTASVSSADIPDDTQGNNSVSITTLVTTAENVPSLSEWGLIGMAGLLVIAFAWRTGLIRRRLQRQPIRRD